MLVTPSKLSTVRGCAGSLTSSTRTDSGASLPGGSSAFPDAEEVPTLGEWIRVSEIANPEPSMLKFSRGTWFTTLGRSGLVTSITVSP
jgi:hypothetical protein